MMLTERFISAISIVLLVLLHNVRRVSGGAVLSSNQNILQESIVLRNATLDDVDGITDIMIDAWAPAPEMKYIYQFRDQYPEYHWECIRRQIKKRMGHESENIIIHVIDAPITPYQKKRRIASLAVWELGLQETGLFSIFDTLVGLHCSDHLDVNITRAIHWGSEFVPYKQRFIDQAYKSQVYLGALGTHPDFDGRGYGAAQVEWGKALARDRGENVTLIASPAGYELYRTIGFEEIANLTFTKVSGDFLTWEEVMVNQI